ncbi:MAG: amylo-alpha-1,6-glucosidase [Candidatus Pacebacteria bacterium]|nr:amylo-alpha-1,6-glucosidase [Candidatus Paceibacterota bacterium]MDR3582987.1 amylo-alpha-1,6-glucosidase [Candidatus Paceibacterota bacterium]
MNNLQKIRGIILSDFRACYRPQGILASNLNFSDFWARDSFWASLGMLHAGVDVEKVRDSLELFLKYQREDGKIPRKIVLDYNGLKYLGARIKRRVPRPIYSSSLKWNFSVDDNLLFAIAFCRWVEKTGDTAFAEKYFSHVARALEFYAKKNLLREDLIFETGFANWEDTIYKKGFVLYSNCLWYEAVRSFEKLCDRLEKNHESKIPNSAMIVFQIRDKFWLDDKNYFADSTVENKPEKYFDLAGNALAIIFDIAHPEQAEKILQNINNENVLHPINYPHYPWHKISPVLFLFGIQDYQNGISWSWIEALLILAQLKVGKTEEAKKTFENFAEIISKNNHIHETYFLDGRPFDHLFWKSAVPFAWGAGLLLWTISELEKIA